MKKLKYFAQNKKPDPALKRLLLISFIFFTFVADVPAFAMDTPRAADPIVRLYPNPATSFINLDLGKFFNKGYSIRVFSFLGRKMHETNNVNQIIKLSVTDYNRGVYVYQVRDRLGKLIESGKFQVSK